MKIKIDGRLLPLLLGTFIIGGIVWGVAKEWVKISGIIRLIFFSIVFAYLLMPICRWLEMRLPRFVATLFLFISIGCLILISLVLFVPILIRQGIALLERLPLFIAQFQNIIGEVYISMEKIGLPYSLQTTLSEYIETIEEGLTQGVRNRMDGAINSILYIAEFFTIPVLSFYFIKDREYFRKTIESLIPTGVRKPIFQVASEINQILHQFIRGQMLVALIVAILATFGYLIIGLPYAFMLGMFAGFFEIIPYFGPFLGAIPAALIAILISPSKLIGAIVVAVMVQQLESNIFTPKIMGDHVGVNPIYIIIALWLGGIFGGIVGMLFAVPIILILRIILKNIYLSIVSSYYRQNMG